MQQKKPKYLGRLCKHGHDHEGTGQSLRYGTSGCCIVCEAQRTAARPYKYRPASVAGRASDKRYQAKPETKAKRRAQVARRRLTGVVQAQHEAWLARNPDYLKQWRTQHPGYWRDYCNQWRTQKPEAWRALRRAANQRRRARLASVPRVTYTGQDLIALFARYADKCAYCADAAVEVDHVVPISLGGHDALYNLAPACQRCNRRKNDDTLEAWYTQQPFFALVRLEFMAEQQIAAGLPRLDLMS